MDVSAISRVPKRVLLTTDAVGGVWRYTVDLVRGLARQGLSVLVASLGPRPSAGQRRQIMKISGADLRESEFALEWMPNPWRDVEAAGEWLLELAQEFRALLRLLLVACGAWRGARSGMGRIPASRAARSGGV